MYPKRDERNAKTNENSKKKRQQEFFVTKIFSLRGKNCDWKIITFRENPKKEWGNEYCLFIRTAPVAKSLKIKTNRHSYLCSTVLPTMLTNHSIP
jgi:hypothetical protein